MANIDVLKGIGAELQVETDYPGFEEMFTDLEKIGLQTVDPESVHVTLVNPYETRIPVYSERDEDAINSARNEVGRYLSLNVDAGLKFTPVYDALKPFGSRRIRHRKVGIMLLEQGTLSDLRSDIEAIFYEEAKIRILPVKVFVGHIALGQKTVEFKKMPHGTSPFTNVARLPDVIPVNGFNITERVMQAKSPKESTEKSDGTRYRNRTKAQRRT